MTISGARKKELENTSARVHISRLDSLKIKLQQEAESVTGKRIEITEQAVKRAYGESYWHTAFEIQRGTGVGVTMQGVDEGKLERLIKRPWAVDGKNFSQRCWEDRSRLVGALDRELTRMTALGEAQDKAIANIAKQFNTSKSNASRLIMTESAAASSAAQKDSFNELGVEKFEVIAALDKTTCPICGALDGKVFDMKEYEVGVTANPFHPNCRCCTAPFFEDMQGVGERIARDVVTGEKYKIPSSMTYEQWKAQQDAKHGEGTVDKMRKTAYNEKADEKQFERYKGVLGADAPTTFESFRKLKYNSPAAFEDLTGYYHYIKNNPSSNKGLYNADKAAKELRTAGKIRAQGTVTVAPKGRLIIDYNPHAVGDMKDRNITKEIAQSIIDNADFALNQRKGTQYAFYTREGYAVLDNDGLLTSVGWLNEGGRTLYEEVMKNVENNK